MMIRKVRGRTAREGSEIDEDNENDETVAQNYDEYDE